MLKRKQELIRLASLDFYTEGPAVDQCGNLYFTMLSGENIMQLNIDGELNIWGKSSCPNGQIILTNGEHFVCDSKLGKVLRFSIDGQLIGAVSGETCAGIKVNVPNDLLMDDHGNLYFTDSIRHHGAVFCITKNGEEQMQWFETNFCCKQRLELNLVLPIPGRSLGPIAKMLLNQTLHFLPSRQPWI